MKNISKCMLGFLFVAQSAVAQKDEAPNGWHLMDKATTGFYGVSADKAHQHLKSKNLKSNTVIVAVIDSGIDSLHEDLKRVMWKNPGEIPNNGKDDDKNGYIDDIHGWNFLGGKDGRNVNDDSYEGARVYYALKAKWGDKHVVESTLNTADRQEYRMFKKAEQSVVGPEAGAGIDLVFLKRIQEGLIKNDSILKIALGKNVYTGNELEDFIPKLPEHRKAKASFYGLMKSLELTDQTNQAFLDNLAEEIRTNERKEETKNSAPRAFRKEIVGDDEDNFNDRNYGNNDLMAKTALHGTHVAGIIAADRTNGKGIDGIADNVRIMMLRAVPNGDEHDKDIAHAIRYAVDNGAQIVTMSFGKSFSPRKQWVDEAIRYAESRNVLIVQAAGNGSENIDTSDNFPSPNFLNGGRAGNLIMVGASGDPKLGGLTASFSNYGKKEVDVFAPGVKIYSTQPGGNVYGSLQGTSFSCPLVAGIAALTLQYYPNLSAKQLKYIIEKSSIDPGIKVKEPGTGEMVKLSDLSRTGGIVNAYEAVKLAGTIKGDRKPLKEILPKPKLIKPKNG